MMNQEQKRYALNRINEVKSQKIGEAREKFRIKAVRLSYEERFNLIYAGKVKLLPRTEISQYTDLSNAYDFSKYETPDGFKPPFIEVEKTINKLSNDARDQIMLGDCAEAIELIKQLENLKV